MAPHNSSNLNQQCAGCGTLVSFDGHRVHCPSCGLVSLLVSRFDAPLELLGPQDSFDSYASWLPYRNVVGISGPRIGCIHAHDLGAAVGVPDLWVVISGYSPRLGSTILTGTFKECEAIGVLNRVREQTDKILVVSSRTRISGTWRKLQRTRDRRSAGAGNAEYHPSRTAGSRAVAGPDS